MRSFDEVTAKTRSFRDDRDRAQIHHPKDMAIAVSPEAGALTGRFLRENAAEVDARIKTHGSGTTEEIIDIAIDLTELADNLDVDLPAAMEDKLEKNALMYSASLARGNLKNYTAR